MQPKNGQWLKLKNHDTVGIIIEQRRRDAELPDRSYRIHIDEQTLLYPPSRFELLPDPPIPENVVRKERWERLAEVS